MGILMNNKQKKDQIREILEICDWLELQITSALKTRILQCDEEEIAGDELCNTLFNIARQASVIDYKIAKLLGE
jgi:hypothetical protein